MSGNAAFSIEYLAQLFDVLPDPVFVKDEQHRWIFANQAFSRLLGRPLHECLNKSDYDLFSKEIADVFWKKDDEIFQRGVPNENEERITLPGGEERTVITKKTPLQTPNGRILVGVIRDITELKEANRRLVASARMVTCGEIAAGLAHDLNNPLAILMGRTQQIKRLLDRGEFNGPPAYKIVDSILHACERSAHVVQELKNLANPSAFRQAASFPVKSLFEHLHSLYRTRCESSGIQLKVEIGRHELWVSGVESELKQLVIALTQFCFHSVEETERSEIHWKVTSDGSMVILQLRDSGEMFQASGGRSIFASAGLHPKFTAGLSVVESIVASAGGTIRSGRSGDSYKFEVRLPLGERPEVGLV